MHQLFLILPLATDYRNSVWLRDQLAPVEYVLIDGCGHAINHECELEFHEALLRIFRHGVRRCSGAHITSDSAPLLSVPTLVTPHEEAMVSDEGSSLTPPPSIVPEELVNGEPVPPMTGGGAAGVTPMLQFATPPTPVVDVARS